MCMPKPPSIPAPPPPVDPKSVAAPSLADEGTAKAVGEARKRLRAAAALASGRGSTILTGPQGLSGGAAGSAKKMVLGE